MSSYFIDNVSIYCLVVIIVLFNKAFIDCQKRSSSNWWHFATTLKTVTYPSDRDNEADVVINRGPYFDLNSSKNITTVVGKTANLRCRVKNLVNQTVSWIRHRDLHLLTVGRLTYTSDQRFSSFYMAQSEDWVLYIKYAQKRDSGVYECQIGTTPPIGHSILLSVIEPTTLILGGTELYINRGSVLNITCVVKNSPRPPPKFRWKHNYQEINYESTRGGISVITEKSAITTSYLLVQNVHQNDSGTYTCEPENANSKSVIIHVLNGELPAAMQHGGQLQLENSLLIMWILTVLVAIHRS